MLLPAEVRPFLLHDDEHVRDQALRYFTDAHDPSPVTAEDLWACLDRFPSSRRSCLTALRSVPATARSIDRLLEELRAYPRGHHPDRWPLARLARDLPPEAARRAIADEAIAGLLPEDVAASMARTIALSELPFHQLLEALRTQVAAMEEDETPGSPAFQACEDIVSALARHPAEAATWALDCLSGRRESADELGWLDLFALGLFRLVPLPASCEILLDHIGGAGGDIAREYASDAIVRLADDQVIRSIESRFLGAHVEFQIFATGALSRIKRPASEEALSRLLGAGAGDDIDTALADALCDLCTTSRPALDRMCRMVLEDAYDPMISDLAEALIATGEMVGWSPPDPAAWRAADARRKMDRELWQQAKELEMRSWKSAKSHAPAAAEKARKPLVFKPYGKKAKKK
jgi:hypothetical protein